MHSNHITHSFYLSLLEFLLTAKQRLMSIGNEFGLSSIQAVTILLLDEDHPRPMKNFCQLYHCDASNITGIIDGLEKKGLVSRRNDSSDRRIKIIQLEAAGKQLQEAIIKRISTDNVFLLDSLDTTEARQFIHLLEKITASTAKIELID